MLSVLAVVTVVPSRNIFSAPACMMGMQNTCCSSRVSAWLLVGVEDLMAVHLLHDQCFLGMLIPVRCHPGTLRLRHRQGKALSSPAGRGKAVRLYRSRCLRGGWVLGGFPRRCR